MKRFLILSLLIVFLTVSCAGPNKVGWTKPDFRQDEFERDREDCFRTYDNSPDLDPFEKVVDECLAKKGYENKKAEEPPSGNTITAKDIGLIALVIVLSPLILAYGVWRIGQAP
jgi:hypothetical protein